ncbi:MAG: NYN domain-containing protein [Oscillospiraceae bacterium]|nr:NYN domain-containing protein [Oscillospiraceae bacterium]
MKIEFKALKPPPGTGELANTIVFIDYEYLYISFMKQYSCPPMLDEICDEIKQHGKVAKIYVFGDFTKPELSQERNRVRTVTSNIIDCGNESTINRKDFTDFIMLDHIYQELIQNPAVEQFVFFTGDGHFASSATFLRNFMEKTVGVYGIAGTLSRQLCNCSSWTKELHAIDGDELEYQTNLLKNLHNAESKGAIATFMKTIEFTIRSYGGDQYRYEQILRDLIEQGYVNNALCTLFPERGEFRMLTVNWERVKKELAPAI